VRPSAFAYEKIIIKSVWVLRPHARPPFVRTDKSENVLWTFYRVFSVQYTMISYTAGSADATGRDGKSPIRYTERGRVSGEHEVGTPSLAPILHVSHITIYRVQTRVHYNIIPSKRTHAETSRVVRGTGATVSLETPRPPDDSILS